MGGDSIDEEHVESEDVDSPDRPDGNDQVVVNGAGSEIRKDDQSVGGKVDETETHTEDGERNR